MTNAPICFLSNRFFVGVRVRPKLKRGVTVALQILVLSVKVRILALQPSSGDAPVLWFFLILFGKAWRVWQPSMSLLAVMRLLSGIKVKHQRSSSRPPIRYRWRGGLSLIHL